MTAPDWIEDNNLKIMTKTKILSRWAGSEILLQEQLDKAHNIGYEKGREAEMKAVAKAFLKDAGYNPKN